MRKYLLLGILALVLSGCTTMQVATVNPKARSIVTSTKIPKGVCKKLAKLKATQDDMIDGGPGLEQGAMDQIKNMAYDKKANYVRITDNYSISKDGTFNPMSIKSVTIKGVAYYCEDVAAKKKTKKFVPPKNPNHLTVEQAV
jgi:hypothetical protein